jgi:hypothetical protein
MVAGRGESVSYGAGNAFDSSISLIPDWCMSFPCK